MENTNIYFVIDNFLLYILYHFQDHIYHNSPINKTDHYVSSVVRRPHTWLTPAASSLGARQCPFLIFLIPTSIQSQSERLKF